MFFGSNLKKRTRYWNSKFDLSLRFFLIKVMKMSVTWPIFKILLLNLEITVSILELIQPNARTSGQTQDRSRTQRTEEYSESNPLVFTLVWLDLRCFMYYNVMFQRIYGSEDVYRAWFTQPFRFLPIFMRGHPTPKFFYLTIFQKICY